MLTKKMLLEMPPQTIFATGTITDSPLGVNMSGSGKLLRWVAKRGGIYDWAIYIHFAEHDIDWIAGNGDKVCYSEHIKKLVLCDDEAFTQYRY